MSLPPAAAGRQLEHRRQVEVQVYSRGDGLWEVDARLTDIKTHDAQLVSGTRAAGQPIHDLLLRLVVDCRFEILQAGSESRATPYPGHCDRSLPGEPGDRYAALVGLNLMRDFRRTMRERVGGTAGCTHLSELAQVLPTAVVQAFAGEVIDNRGDGEGAVRPFQLDRCHALASDGEAVRLFYPRWLRRQDAGAGPSA